jgi:hypothetical protein
MLRLCTSTSAFSALPFCTGVEAANRRSAPDIVADPIEN